MCLRFLQLFVSSSSLLACTLPILGSANSASGMNSKIVGVTNRITDISPHSDIFVTVNELTLHIINTFKSIVYIGVDIVHSTCLDKQ